MISSQREAYAGQRLQRENVGGRWRIIGQLQFDYLVLCGLKPEHKLLDIGCGCLRGGLHFTRYLKPSHYMGFDIRPAAIGAAWHELANAKLLYKQPLLYVTDSFDMSYLPIKPDYSIAQSVFTHIPPDQISLCLKNLRSVVEPGHTLFATFFNGEKRIHENHYYEYSIEEMVRFGNDNGLDAKYIGDWQHPRNQKMIQYTVVQNSTME